MQQLNGVIYDSRPSDTVVYETMVDVVVLCTPINIVDEQTGKSAVKFKCNIERYTTDEYINKINSDKKDLSNQVTELQLAIVEVFELFANS